MKRSCAYCPEPGPDVCVRTWSTGDGTTVHVYAHRACADARGVIPMYSILDEPAGKGQRL